VTDQYPDGQLALSRIKALQAISDDPHCLTRLYLSPAYQKSVDLMKIMMRDAGCDDVWVDGLGTVTGRYNGSSTDAKSILIGSHIDTVVDAGAYDGTFGVVAGLGLVENLKKNNKRFPFAIEILAFGDEENIRFPSNLSSSRAVSGTFDPAILQTTDSDGIRFQDALASCGFDSTKIAQIKRNPDEVIGYLELHIEQGPVLQHENLAVGIVTSINGASRRRVKLTGLAGHAGTVPMPMRQDALTGAAEIALAVEKIASRDPFTVATIGKLVVRPNATNVIPGNVEFTLDMRGPDDTIRLDMVRLIEDACRKIAEQRHLEVKIEAYYDAEACPCDRIFQNSFEQGMTQMGLKPYYLPSGAGHDAMAMSALCPVAMLFVRCKDGISHNPAEFCSVEDMDVAISVLYKTVETLARQNHTHSLQS
jgi:allantoate deiminase